MHVEFGICAHALNGRDRGEVGRDGAPHNAFNACRIICAYARFMFLQVRALLTMPLCVVCMQSWQALCACFSVVSMRLEQGMQPLNWEMVLIL